MSEWIKWDGGKCPVDGRTTVEVTTKGGLVEKSEACLFSWKHYSTESDIIKYKIAVDTFTNEESKPDQVKHPPHYTAGKVECIDALEAATVNLSGIEAVCTANAIKYLWRWKQKGGKQDLEKAKWYIDHLLTLDGQ